MSPRTRRKSAKWHTACSRPQRNTFSMKFSKFNIWNQHFEFASPYSRKYYFTIFSCTAPSMSDLILDYANLHLSLLEKLTPLISSELHR